MGHISFLPGGGGGAVKVVGGTQSFLLITFFLVLYLLNMCVLHVYTCSIQLNIIQVYYD